MATASRPSKAKNTSERAWARAVSSVRRTSQGPVLDLDKYVPGLLTLIASNLSGGASNAYLSLYAVGIETWRVMVMMALEGRVTAQRMVQLLDADKGSISRTFKFMHERGLIAFEEDVRDGRVRHAVFTPAGRALHDRIIRLASLREQVALSVLSEDEVEVLRDLLRRVYANLPEVERATDAFLRRERTALGMEPNAPALRRRGAQQAGAGTQAASRPRASKRASPTRGK
jgi:DNA-binding MarR family transcriptional regulator